MTDAISDHFGDVPEGHEDVPSDLRATTAGLRTYLDADWFGYANTKELVDEIVGMAAGRALLRRKLAEHDAALRSQPDDHERGPHRCRPLCCCDGKDSTPYQPEGDAS